MPISKLAEAVEETRADIDSEGLTGPILGHVGDGNYHSTLLVDPGNEDHLKKAKALAGRMAERALKLGGTVTGEHGVGIGKMDLLEQEHGEATRVMAEIKRSLDPSNLMNPGKVVRLN